ncbi:MAG: helix-turn-helix domain-containing protein [Chloroflexi bacterium]|nr:helix-turn-helix domain-containing protein [Chloroflexota bacterium]
MSLPTVRDLLAGALPSPTRVAAGCAGLERTVSWVVVLRPRPPALPALRGGELALVNPQALRRLEPPLTLKQVAERLGARGVSALAVLGAADEATVQVAETLGLPLLELPADANLHELQGEITHLIAERRTLLFSHGMEVQRRLAELAIAGRGLGAVTRALADLTGRAVLFQDETLRVVETAAVGPAPAELPPLQPPDAGALLRSGQPLRASDPPTARLAGEDGLARWVALVVVEGAIVGYLSLVGSADDLGELDRLAVSQAATVCAYQIARERAIAAAEERVRGEFLSELLESPTLGEEAAVERGRHLGYDLARPHVGVVLADDRGPTDGRPQATPGWRSVVDLAQRTCGTQLPWLARRERLVLLCPLGGAAQLEALAEAVDEARRRAAAQRGVAVSAGVGRAQQGVAGLRRSVREAEQALAIAQHLLGGDQTARFESLGVFRLLFALHGSTELETFHDELLGPVIAYDERTHADLVHTLEVLFAQGGNLQRAAEALYVHRNTLAYRLRRVEELTGLRLDDPEAALRLHLALKIHRVLTATRTARSLAAAPRP